MARCAVMFALSSAVTRALHVLIWTLDIHVRKHICCKKQRKPPAVRTVSKDRSKSLEQALLKEREKVIATNTGYKMLGNELVLPMGCIVGICRV